MDSIIMRRWSGCQHHTPWEDAADTTTPTTTPGGLKWQLYLRSPTNNILTSLRILSGVDTLGKLVCVKHLCSCLDEGYSQPSCPLGLARLLTCYVRISAPVYAGSGTDRYAATELYKPWDVRESNTVFLTIFHLPGTVGSDGGAAGVFRQLIYTQTWLWQQLQRPLASVLPAPPLRFSRLWARAKIVYYERVTLKKLSTWLYSSRKWEL